MLKVNSIFAHDLKQLHIGQGGVFKRTKFQSSEKKSNSITIPVYVEPQGRFCVFCLSGTKSSSSSVHTKTGVTIIRLANKHPCPFLLAKLTMKDTLLGMELMGKISRFHRSRENFNFPTHFHHLLVTTS